MNARTVPRWGNSPIGVYAAPDGSEALSDGAAEARHARAARRRPRDDLAAALSFWSGWGWSSSRW
jgi:hypothetical protein